MIIYNYNIINNDATVSNDPMILQINTIPINVLLTWAQIRCVPALKKTTTTQPIPLPLIQPDPSCIYSKR